jgi:DNA-binding transcriptional MerR regulator
MASASTLELYRSRDVAQILGISRRQLQYWAKTDLVRPSQRSPGGHHRYAFQDLIALKAAKRLIDAGVSVQRLRESICALRRVLPTVNRPLAELVLVATGDIVLVLHEGSAFEAATGQEWVFEVAQFQRELEAWKQKPKPLARRRSAPSTGSGATETGTRSGAE